MGLAEPRKRQKISHDPRNTQWTSSTTSIGHRLMIQQGWSRGQALGARSSTPTNSSGTSTPKTPTTSAAASAADAARLTAARVGVLFKDDTLGLGASLQSKDPNAKTGLDAFQGLLGRLNAKDKAEEEAVERKLVERRLEGYARGKWGMTFVPGGVLVQGDEFKNKREAARARDNGEGVEEAKSTEHENETEHVVVEANEVLEKRKRKFDEKKKKKKKRKTLESGEATNLPAAEAGNNPANDKSERRRRKQERGKQKEERRAAKASRTQAEHTAGDGNTTVLSSKSTSRSKTKTAESSKFIATTPDEAQSPLQLHSSSSSSSRRSQIQCQSPTSPSLHTNSQLPPTPAPVRSGRQILRSRNIDAKRKAFVDERALAGIFMRASTSTPASA